MIVLSLFDGMSCGRVALERAGWIKTGTDKIMTKAFPLHNAYK